MESIKLKTFIKIYSFILLIMMSFGASSAPGPAYVTDTYTAGDTLTATKMTNIKDVINDHNSFINSNITNISTNTSNIGTNTTDIATKQNRVAGVCASGYAIQSINADGTVVCEQDNDSGGDITAVTAGAGLSGGGTTGTVDIKRASGSISIHNSAFSSDNTAICQSTMDGIKFNWDTSSTGTSCWAHAPLMLPDGATITGLSCSVFDNDAGGFNAIYLNKLSGYSVNSSIYTGSSIDSATYQTVSIATNFSVDNSLNIYSLAWLGSHDTSSVGSNAGIVGCHISYTY
jgi:hypothetical protein